jgi:hypothetical protein
MNVRPACLGYVGTLYIYVSYPLPIILALSSIHPSTDRIGMCLHRKKRFTSFPSSAGMSITKLPLSRNNSVKTSLFPPRESLVLTSRLGTGNSRAFFLRSLFKGLQCKTVHVLVCLSNMPIGKGPKNMPSIRVPLTR